MLGRSSGNHHSVLINKQQCPVAYKSFFVTWPEEGDVFTFVDLLSVCLFVSEVVRFSILNKLFKKLCMSMKCFGGKNNKLHFWT